MPRSITLLPLVLAALLANYAFGATKYTWPTVAPCTGTLNACVALTQSGDEVEILTYQTINESIDVPNAVSLSAPDGYRAIFAPGNHIKISNGLSPLTLERLTLLGGYVDVSSSGLVTLRHLDVTNATDSDDENETINIRFAGGLEVSYNVVHGGAQSGCVLCVSSLGSNHSYSIHDNRLYGAGGEVFFGVDGSGLSAKIFSNQLFDTTFDLNTTSQTGGEIDIVNNVMLCPKFPDVAGMNLALAGSLTINTYHNSVVGCALGIWFDGAPSGGRISGNLVANSQTKGLSLENGAAAVLTNDHNLVFGNAVDRFQPGPGTIAVDPQFAWKDSARLKSTSPAIDASDLSALASLLDSRGIPSIDADGLRRFKGPDGIPDIGAYEYGDISIVQVVNATETVVAPDNLNPGSFPQVMEQQANVSVPDVKDYIGFKPNWGRLDLIAESTGASPVAQSTFNIFSPGIGGGRFVHMASATNVSGFTTRIDDPSTDGHPERIVIATLNGPVNFPHPFATVYAAGHWYIQQLDAHTGDPDFPSAIQFDIYAQDPSFNAFIVNSGAGGFVAAIDNPVAADPCARMVVGNSPTLASPIKLYSLNGSWVILGEVLSMPAGARFPIIIDEAGTAFCRENQIFHGDFEFFLGPI